MEETEKIYNEVVNLWPLTRAYRDLFDELREGDYVVRNVYQHYVENAGHPDTARPTVVLRIDVDSGFHLSWPLAVHLHQRGLTATHYFLTHPQRYYNLWVSDIPKKIASLGQEVGLHSDHYYEELAFGKNGLAEMRSDILKLSELCGSQIRGMVYHGHKEINAMGVTNWMLTADIASDELGLRYHDGLHSSYIAPGSDTWRPKCDYRISDYMGISHSWGWNYHPKYPVSRLKKLAKPNTTFHIAFHTKNAFRYWVNWPDTYSEKPRLREQSSIFLYKKMRISYLMLRTALIHCMPPRQKNFFKKLIGRL